MKKITVGILFGGQSAEHEVSLQSAKNVLDAIDKKRYQPVLISIDKKGQWHINDAANFLLNAENPKLIRLNQQRDEVPITLKDGGEILSLENLKVMSHVDVIFPILHGPLGEDGTIQGLLKLADIPFVGAGVLGSSIGMDKDVMKRLLRDAGLPISDFVTVKSTHPLPTYLSLIQKLGPSFFVKPANMGSSVGISKVMDESGYERAIEVAFQYDRKIIIEEFIEGREIECAVLGNDEPFASVLGEIVSSHDFYSYDAKYIDEKGAKLKIPANLSETISKKIQALAIETFNVLSCEGMGRVDFFLKKSDEIIINEINTIPGFTKISMYPRLWEASGISYSDLIHRLIQLACKRFEMEKGHQKAV